MLLVMSMIADGAKNQINQRIASPFDFSRLEAKKRAGNGSTVVNDDDEGKRSQNGEERYTKKTFLKRLKAKFFG